MRCWELAAAIKMEITERRQGGKIQLIICADDNGVGGYHNKGGENEICYSVLMI